MVVSKLDVVRGAELLDSWRRQLPPAAGADRLAADVDRLVRILRSPLLLRLLDIRAWYERALLEGCVSAPEGTPVTGHRVSSWQWAGSPDNSAQWKARGASHPVTSTPVTSSVGIRGRSPLHAADESRSTELTDSAGWDEEPVTTPLLQSSNKQAACDDGWECEEVVLCRTNQGLGFSIAGGMDNPHCGEEDAGIYITKVMPDGPAACDGRLGAGDRIATVNGINVSGATHEQAVDALRTAGTTVQLSVKRRRHVPKPEMLETIELHRGSEGLGFSIAGGIGNQHIPGDNGIFVTKLVSGGAAQIDGRLAPGDRLVSVDNGRAEVLLSNVTHEQAVAALKSATVRVVLTVARPAPAAPLKTVTCPGPAAPSVPPASQEVAADRRRTPPPAPPLSISNDRCYAKDNNTSASDSFNTSTLSETAAVEHITREPRQVVLERVAGQGLGFNIVGGDSAEGIFVSSVLPGGPAASDRGDRLYRGDQVTAVNGTDVTEASHDRAAALIQGAGPAVILLVQHRPELLELFERRARELRQLQIMSGTLLTTQKRSLYVRTLFDYDPRLDDGLPSRGLAFRFGDLLHVTNASDDQWWQARRLGGQGQPLATGIVPSRGRWQRKARARARSVGFHGRVTDMTAQDKRKTGFSFSRRFPFMKSKEDVRSDGNSDTDLSWRPGRLRQRGSLQRRSGSLGSLLRLFSDLPEAVRRRARSTSAARSTAESTANTSELEDRCGEGEPVPTYEPVQQVEVSYCRPVVVLGPLKDRVNEDLISQYPDDFVSCVPHTTRPAREGEQDGRDYHFVPCREDMERDIGHHRFVEAGQFSGHLYGTALDSVRTVAEEEKKHCILDVGIGAIKRLHAAQLYPIAVLIHPRSAEQTLEWNKRLTEEAAKKTFEKCQKLASEFCEYLTAIVRGDTPEEVYERVKGVIREQGTNRIWIPSHEEL